MKNKIFVVFLVLISIIFTYLNYSLFAWNFFNSIGGIALAKVAPEILGIIFFSFLAFNFWKKEKEEKLSLKKDFPFLFCLLVITFAARILQFRTNFFKDDFYFWLIRTGAAGYSIYMWGPWLSSHPAWVWETVRLISGENPLGYQIAVLLSHFLFVIGVYFLAKYLSKDKTMAFVAALFFSITTIHFQAFEWLSHVSNFGWQGFLMCLSLLALVWQINKDKGKKPTYISTFLMMATFASGIARTGAIPLIVLGTDFLCSRRDIKGIIRRQWLMILLVVTFFLTRKLFSLPTVRIETVNVPSYLTFFWLMGAFTFPPEIIRLLGFISNFWLGSMMILLAIIYTGLLIFLTIFKKVPIVVSLGFFWTLSFALYYTFWGPHVPVTFEALQHRIGPHHLAYPSVVGTSIIVGYYLVKIGQLINNFLRKRFSNNVAKLIILSMVLILLGINLINLNILYRNFINECLIKKDDKLEICQI